LFILTKSIGNEDKHKTANRNATQRASSQSRTKSKKAEELKNEDNNNYRRNMKSLGPNDFKTILDSKVLCEDHLTVSINLPFFFILEAKKAY